MQKGTVTWFREDRGYGFIRYINTDEAIAYIYFNRSGISNGVTVTKEDEVSFKIEEVVQRTPQGGDRGYRAARRETARRRTSEAVDVKLIDE
jgi:cold shock CspA family protein